jgi:CubicO group peptidase (beta-lactamase class C family)
MKLSIALFALICCISLNAQTPDFITSKMDAYIKQGLKDFNIPGLAIAVVKDGKTVVMKGFGVKGINNAEPIDENSLFIIASNSKLFTGTAISMLHQNKQLNLNDKVTKYIPDFKLYDATSTALVTVKDLLCHRLGTGTFQGDFTFWDSNLTEDEIIFKMRSLKPTQNFRSDYGYCNSAFLAAGALIPKVMNGKTWFSFVQDSILNPIGMTNTFMYTKNLPSLPNHAIPHNDAWGNITEIPYDNVDNLGPATSMVSCVKDVAKWLQFQLDSGKVNGKQVIPWPVLQRTRDVNIITGSRKSSVYPMHFRGYGLGVFTADYAGKQIYWHTGGAFGYVTNTCFIPEENLAITILTNNDNQSFFEALRYQILDAYLQPNLPYINRAAPLLKGKIDGDAEIKKTLAELKSKASASNKMPITEKDLIGTYTNSVYGKITITKNNEAYQVNFEHHPTLNAKLEYVYGNSFKITYNNIAYGIFEAPIKIEKGKIKSISIKASDFVEYDAYEFVKK